MATLLYPATIPGPSPGHELMPQETRYLIESGAMGVSSRTRDQLHELSLEFDLSDAEFALWWAWWRDDLAQGGNFFSADWLIFGTATVRFTSEPEVRSLPGLRKAVKIKAVARGRSAAPDTSAAPSFQVLTQTSIIESSTPLVWQISFSSPTSDVVTLTLAFTGTATVTTDYTLPVTTPTSGASVSGNTLTVNAGVRVVTLNMAIVNDVDVEADETLTLTATRTSGTTSNETSSASVVLTSDDTPGFSVADTTAAEASGFATFTISLNAASSSTTTVAYYTEGATALPIVDYIHTEGTLVFQAGETSKTVTVPLISDGVAEGNETFLMKLQLPWGAVIVGDTGVCTIT